MTHVPTYILLFIQYIYFKQVITCQEKINSQMSKNHLENLQMSKESLKIQIDCLPKSAFLANTPQ